MTSPLEELLDEHERASDAWHTTGREDDRLAMRRTWEIGLTQPGNRWNQRADLSVWTRCTPTVLDRETGNPDAHLEYCGACLGCGWVSPNAHLFGQGGENAAVEAAHDHTHPEWREVPIVAAVPAPDSPSQYARQIARWREQWEPLLPVGWLDAGGPVRTPRDRGATRHVPCRAPGGGYDLAVPDGSRLADPHGQLSIL
jgi:hypothetical protein